MELPTRGARVNATRAIVAQTTANIVALEPARRPRGRPRTRQPMGRAEREAARKAALAAHGPFGAVALAVVGVASQKTLWAAAKERVRNWADRDSRLRPVSKIVLGFILEHINRSKGLDWHSTAYIAADVGHTSRAVELAWEELLIAGYTQREPVTRPDSSKSTRPWRTTVPALIRAAQEVSAEREQRARKRLGIGSEPEQKIDKDPNGNSPGPEQKGDTGPEQMFGQTLDRPNLEKNLSADAPSGNSNTEARPFVGYGEQIRRLRPRARYDTSLPMAERLTIPGGRYGSPTTDADVELLKRLKRAARGWDLHQLRDKFCARAVSAQTTDAIEGFDRWMRRYKPTPAPNYLSTKR